MTKLKNFLKERLCVRGKIIFGAIGAAFLFFLGSAHYTYADIFGISSITTAAISQLAYWVVYALAWIFGAFIAVEAWLIGVVLNINSGIMQTSFVQTGFSISLSVANLAFVLGIIVIALATILRIENYSIKKMLWKLVVMAILVNFGLVIMAPIVGFSNSLTQYFLNCINPAGGGCTQTTSSVSSFNNFAQTMAGKFNPQAMFAGVPNPTQGTGIKTAPFGLITGAADIPIGAALVPLFSLVFTVVDFVLIVFVLGAFIVMLMIRYIYLAILAILLPFAWASWVFPSFSSMYSKWWNKFLQWTFFAPIFMFFLYLALATIGGSNNADALNSTDYVGNGNMLFNAILNFFGSGIQPIITNLLQEMVLGGLIIGGMIAADSMGVKFAGSAVKVAQNGGKAIQGYVSKQSKKAGRATFRKVRGEKAVNAMREGRFLGLQGVPGLKWVTSRGASVVGRAISPNLSNSDLVDAEKKNVPENPEAIKQNLKGNMNMEANFAHLAKLIEKGELDENTMVGNQKASAWMDAHEKDAINYGFTKSAKDADKVLGNNRAMRVAAGGLTAEDMKDPDNLQARELRNATIAFVRGLKNEDISKLNVNKVFDAANATNPIQAELARSFATDGPGDAAKAIGKMSSATKVHFKKIYEEQIGEASKTPNLIALTQAAAEVNELTADKADKKIIEAAENRRKAIENNLTEQERNVRSASKYFKASLDANATFGGADPATTPTAPPPTPIAH